MPSTELEPSVLHADVDAFFASVAQRDDPSLRDKPVIVGSWVVMAASYEARAYGIRGGMSAAKARRLCPDLLIAEPEFTAYVEASRAVFAIFRKHAPVVEPGSMEEAFLDLRGRASPSTPPDLARTLRREVRDEVGLPLSIGVARTKILAKLASRAAKPDGLLVVAPDEELAFLHPMAVERLWGVGPATARKLQAHGLLTVGQVAAQEEAALVAVLGKQAGRYVHAVAQNRDPRPVQRRRSRRSFGAQRSLGRSPKTPEALDEALTRLVEKITRRMEKAGRAGRTVVLRLRFDDMTRATRSRTLPHATAVARTLLAAARGLLAEARPLIERRGITLVGISVTNLDGHGSAHQLALALGEEDEGDDLAPGDA